MRINTLFNKKIIYFFLIISFFISRSESLKKYNRKKRLLYRLKKMSTGKHESLRKRLKSMYSEKRKGKKGGKSKKNIKDVYRDKVFLKNDEGSISQKDIEEKDKKRNTANNKIILGLQENNFYVDFISTIIPDIISSGHIFYYISDIFLLDFFENKNYQAKDEPKIISIMKNLISSFISLFEYQDDVLSFLESSNHFSNGIIKINEKKSIISDAYKIDCSQGCFDFFEKYFVIFSKKVSGIDENDLSERKKGENGLYFLEGIKSQLMNEKLFRMIPSDKIFFKINTFELDNSFIKEASDKVYINTFLSIFRKKNSCHFIKYIFYTYFYYLLFREKYISESDIVNSLKKSIFDYDNDKKNRAMKNVIKTLKASKNIVEKILKIVHLNQDYLLDLYGESERDLVELIIKQEGAPEKFFESIIKNREKGFFEKVKDKISNSKAGMVGLGLLGAGAVGFGLSTGLINGASIIETAKNQFTNFGLSNFQREFSGTTLAYNFSTLSAGKFFESTLSSPLSFINSKIYNVTGSSMAASLITGGIQSSILVPLIQKLRGKQMYNSNLFDSFSGKLSDALFNKKIHTYVNFDFIDQTYPFNASFIITKKASIMRYISYDIERFYTEENSEERDSFVRRIDFVKGALYDQATDEKDDLFYSQREKQIEQRKEDRMKYQLDRELQGKRV